MAQRILFAIVMVVTMASKPASSDDACKPGLFIEGKVTAVESKMVEGSWVHTIAVESTSRQSLVSGHRFLYQGVSPEEIAEYVWVGRSATCQATCEKDAEGKRTVRCSFNRRVESPEKKKY